MPGPIYVKTGQGITSNKNIEKDNVLFSSGIMVSGDITTYGLRANILKTTDRLITPELVSGSWLYYHIGRGRVETDYEIKTSNGLIVEDSYGTTNIGSTYINTNEITTQETMQTPVLITQYITPIDSFKPINFPGSVSSSGDISSSGNIYSDGLLVGGTEAFKIYTFKRILTGSDASNGYYVFTTPEIIFENIRSISTVGNDTTYVYGRSDPGGGTYYTYGYFMGTTQLVVVFGTSYGTGSTICATVIAVK